MANTAGLRIIGNALPTPLRIGGEILNAGANIPRQGISMVKNIAEVTKQTLDALVHNFTHFSKVKGKRYQRLSKGTFNLASACTRRPFTIMLAGGASMIHQGVFQPFKKLFYTPGKMFKGMRNAMRIGSKKKGFDFVHYDTHKTESDTRINQVKEQGVGFFDGEVGSTTNTSEDKIEKFTEDTSKKDKKKPDSKQEAKDSEQNKQEAKDSEQDKQEAKDSEQDKQEAKDSEQDKQEAKDSDSDKQKEQDSKSDKQEEKPKSIDEIRKKNKNEALEKDDAEAQKKERKFLDRKEKAEHEKTFKKLLNNDMSEEGVLVRAKKNKKGKNIEQVLATVKKESPTFAGYIEDEILAKKAPASATA